MQEKCPVMLTCCFGVAIVDDEFTWGHVRQTVLLQGKVPGDCCVAGSEVGCFWLADPSDSWHAHFNFAMTNYAVQDFYL